MFSSDRGPQTDRPEPQSAAPQSKFHNNNFGFIRLLLATLVVLQHAYFLRDGSLEHEPLWSLTRFVGLGSVAVSGFFLLSGYLITQSWARHPKFPDFLRNRVLRIYPGFLASAVLTIFVFGRIGASRPDYFQSLNYLQIAKCLTLLQIPGRLPAFANVHSAGVLNGSYWTIPAEFLCYLFVGLAGLTGLLRRRWPILVVCVVMLALPAGFADYALPLWIRSWQRLLLQQFLSLVPPFLAGSCFYLFRDRISITRAGLALAAAAFVLCLLHPGTGHIGVPLAGGYLLFAAAFARLPRLRSIGQKVDLSYGIYLYHWPCQLVIVSHFPNLSAWAVFGISLACAALLATMSWHWVERPAMQFRRTGRTSRAPETVRLAVSFEESAGSKL